MNTALTLLAGLRLEDGRPWIEAATDWQVADAMSILEPHEGDPLLHYLTRPRSGSKTSDLAGIALAALIDQVPPGGRMYGLAVDRDQARLLVDAIAGYVVRTPGLSGAVTVDRFACSTPQGARLEIVSADEASSYGLRGHLYVLDELSMWPAASRGVWVSIVSALPKIAGARLVVLSSAGDPSHWSYQVRERARVSDAWNLHEVPGPVPWVSPDALAEQRQLLTTSQYERLHLNIWCASENRLTSVEDLQAAVTRLGPSDYRPGTRYEIGVDVGLRNDRTAIAVCHAEAVEGRERSKRVVLDRMTTFEGTKADEVSLADVEETLYETWRTYGRPRLRIDPWQAVGLAQRLRARGVYSIEEWSYSDRRYGSAASALFGLLRDGLLALYDHPALLDELANVRLRDTSLPGVVRVDHDSGKHDDMVQALGFAVVALVERSHGGGRILVAQGDVPRVRLTPDREHTEPPPAVVRAGEERPTDKLLRFSAARKHPAYKPPGTWRGR